MDFGIVSGPTLLIGIASAAATIGSTVLSAGAARAQGKQQQDALNFEAKQLEQKAEEERAIATRDVADNARQKKLALSRARAVGGASGGGRDFDLEADVDEEGDYRRLTALYDGEVRARNFRTQAGVRRREGSAAARAGFIRGASTIATGASSMFAKYA
ncbi:MAG: hypothetical protein AB8B85_05215 [Paracoccaceae bacterium]